MDKEESGMLELCGRTAQVEHLMGKKRFKIVYREEAPFFHHERVQLSAQNSNCFLEMFFLMEEKQYCVYYDYTQCISFQEYMENLSGMQPKRLSDERDALALIDVLVGVFMALKEAEEYLLFLERYELNVDCIFISVKERRPRICYIPVKEEKIQTRNNKIESFLREVGQLSKNQTFIFMLDGLLERMERENLGIYGLMNALHSMHRNFMIALR